MISKITFDAPSIYMYNHKIENHEAQILETLTLFARNKKNQHNIQVDIKVNRNFKQNIFNGKY